MTGSARFNHLSLPKKLPTTDAEWAVVAQALEQQFGLAPTDLPHIHYLATQATASTSGSASFVDWPSGGALTGTIYKRYGPETGLWVIFMGTAYVTGVGGLSTWGVNLVGTDGNGYASADNGVTRYFFNALSDHRQIVGALRIQDLPAGSYTATLRAALSGGGTLTADTGDDNRLLFIENLDIRSQSIA